MTRDSGLTLVEILMVLLLMGVVLALAAPSFTNVFVEASIDSAAAWVIGDVRYAQSLAIRTQQTHSVEFDAANDTYRVVDQDGVVVPHPLSKQQYLVAFASRRQLAGVDLVSASFGGASQVSFDALGAPQSGGAITLSYADRQRVISIVYPTGRVTLQ